MSSSAVTIDYFISQLFGIYLMQCFIVFSHLPEGIEGISDKIVQ